MIDVPAFVLKHASKGRREIRTCHVFTYVFDCQKGFGNPKVALCAVSWFNDGVVRATKRPGGMRSPENLPSGLTAEPIA